MTGEIEKLQAVQGESQRIGEFLDWLQGERKLVIAQWQKRNLDPSDDWDELVPAGMTINGLLAEFFEIDLDKIEEEKLALLNELRRANAEAKS